MAYWICPEVPTAHHMKIENLISLYYLHSNIACPLETFDYIWCNIIHTNRCFNISFKFRKNMSVWLRLFHHTNALWSPLYDQLEFENSYCREWACFSAICYTTWKLQYNGFLKIPVNVPLSTNPNYVLITNIEMPLPYSLVLADIHHRL